MANKNKIAGKERPYSFSEFLRKMEEMAKEQNIPCFDIFDYFQVFHTFGEENFLDDWDIQFVSETKFGCNEGIYTDFDLWQGGKRIDFATAKTLYTDDESFVNMHIFAAKFTLLMNKYVEKHEDEFNWKGFDVKFVKNEKPYGGWWCPNIENANKKAEEMKAEDSSVKVFIRNNKTRVRTEYK